MAMASPSLHICNAWQIWDLRMAKICEEDGTRASLSARHAARWLGPFVQMLRVKPECGGAKTLPTSGRRLVQEDQMQRQIGVGLGTLLGLLMISGAEAAPRDGRYVIGHGAGAVRISGGAKGYGAPAVRTVQPAAAGYVAGGFYGPMARADGYRAAAPAWGYAGQGYGYLRGGYAANPGWGYGGGPAYGYIAAPNLGYAATPSWGYGPGPSYGSVAQSSSFYAVTPSRGYAAGQVSGYVAGPGYVAVPYATGPAYGYTTKAAYNRPFAADPVFGYYPVLYPW
jgi:hypothetical protein